MERIYEQSLLYDFYGELLTDHQKAVYEDYVLNDLSLSEIAEERNISRQGVYDIVRRCNKQLDIYEEKLRLVEKFIATKRKIEEIHQCADDILKNQDNKDKMVESVRTIEQISNKIIETM